jgi:hypothetical protein
MPSASETVALAPRAMPPTPANNAEAIESIAVNPASGSA